MIEQGSPEWFERRRGKVTASRVADLMAKTKSGYAASRKNYMMQLLCERLTGEVEETFSNAAMKRGVEVEPQARSAYEVTRDVMVDIVDMVDHPSIPMFAASPDGYVTDDGLVEIKCPNTAQHVEFLRTDKPDGRYIKQMQSQIACTGRAWCDFASFDDRMPEPLQLKVVRVKRDADLISEIEAEVCKFLAELDELEGEMRWMMDNPNSKLLKHDMQ